MIRILLVDDQSTVRQGWRMRLALETDMDVVGEAANGAEALRLIQDLKPDVVLMDLEMPVMDGIAAMRTLNGWGLACGVVMVSMYDSNENRQRARQAGVNAFVGKQQPTETLLFAIRQAAATVRRGPG